MKPIKPGADGEEGEQFGADRRGGGEGADRIVHQTTLNVIRAKKRILMGAILTKEVSICTKK